MTVFKRVLVEKGFALTVVATGTALALGLYVFVVYPWSARVEAARQREQTATQELVAAGRALEAARALTDGKNRANVQLRQFYSEMLPSSLAGARGITYPRLAELAGSHDLVLEQRSSAPEGDDESRLATLRTRMLLGGDWPDIRRFIYALEAAAEFIVIEDMTLSQSEEEDALQMLTLTVTTYYEAAGGS